MIYRVLEREVQILALIHGSRDLVILPEEP